jgi:hypothetical protein
MQLTMCYKLKSALQTRQYTGNAQKFGRVLDAVANFSSLRIELRLKN